jgi:hypothetical protein
VEFQEKEEALDRQIKEVDAEAEELERGEITELRAKLDETNGTLKMMESQFAELQALKAKVAEIATDREAIAKEMETAKAENKVAIEEKEKVDSVLQESQARLERAKEAEAECLALRYLNDGKERDRPLQSIKDDIANHGREGERVALRTVETHAQYEEAERQLAAERAGFDKHISDLEQEIKKVEAEREHLAEKRLKVEAKQLENRSSTAKEVESYHVTAEKLKEAIKVQEEKNRELAEDMEKEKQNKIDELNQRLALEKRRADYKLKVLIAGARILEETEEECKKLQEPIEEDDEEALELECEKLKNGKE